MIRAVRRAQRPARRACRLAGAAQRIDEVGDIEADVVGEGAGAWIVEPLAGVLEVEHVVAEAAEAADVGQVVPGDAAERVGGDESGDDDLHRAPSRCSGRWSLRSACGANCRAYSSWKTPPRCRSSSNVPRSMIVPFWMTRICVGAPHGAQAVRDDERGAAAHHLLDGFHDRRFGAGVDRGCRLVEDQDRARRAARRARS